MRRLIAASAATASLALLAACGSTSPPTPSTIVLSEVSVTLGAVGATHTLTATVKDKSGQTISGAAVTWASDNASVATVNASGVITSVANGTAHVTATSGSASASAAVTVTQLAAQLTKVKGDGQSALEGTAVADSVVVKVTDSLGAPVNGVPVSFSVVSGGGSISPIGASTGATGLAATQWTLGPAGTQSLKATAGAASALTQTFAATAIAAGPVSVTSVTPDTLTENGTATIIGTGFDSVAANDKVTVDGVVATVMSASDTMLTISVPTYDCLPARTVTVQASVGLSNANPFSKPLKPASYTTLSVGQQQIVQSPANFCFQFAPSTTGGDQYLIGVGAATESPATLNAFTLTASGGLGPAPLAAPTSPMALPMTSSSGAKAPLVQSALEQEVERNWRRQYRSEAVIRNFERTYLPTLPMPRRDVAAAPTLAGAPTGTLAGVPSVGDTMTIRVPTFGSNACTNYTKILTVVKAVGASGIWVSDTGNPNTVDSLTDADIQAYSDTFDTKIYATDTSYFGAPSDIDGNGRIIIVLTIAVNKEMGGSVAGFVFGGDLFSPVDCASSDSGEIFYGQVPDPNNASNTGARSKAAVVYQMPSLIAHEFTHDIQESRRIIIHGSNVPMNAWEAEGQAMFAQNAVGDDVLGNTSGSNYGWATAHTGQGARWYGQGFDLLAAYYGSKYTAPGKNANAPEQCSLYASTSTTLACFNFAFYGAAYSFEKYITDRSGPGYTGSVGGEKGLQHDVIDGNPTLAGRANWSALLGLTSSGFDSVFSQWSAMLWVDDSVPGIAPELQMTSWNLANIFGPSGYGSTTCDTSCQLLPVQESWGAFSQSRSVRDGSNAYTLLTSSGPRSALAIKARNGGGGTLSTTMAPQFWIVRTK
ncbi:MAG TPA: Ig-like domain-containing protein [Gemmatimonadales bacterium]|nr:Ig-like domain-containing protein [Gemmatimonadales bacterium]